MWARLTELAFGAWLFASPFVFDPSSPAASTRLTDFVAGALLLMSTVVNYRYPSKRFHLAVPILGAWLIAGALLSGPHPIAPARQNHIMVGLTLLMLGIVPNEALRPPQSWQTMRGEQARRTGR